MRALKNNWMACTVAVLPFLLGGYFGWTSALVSAVCLCVLIGRIRREKTLVVSRDVGFIAIMSIPICLLLSVFWAQDRGLAPLGFFQFLPAGLFALASLQESPEKKEIAIEIIPWSGALMTVIGVPLSYLPVMEGHLLVNGRQAGFFEYPNTYALFLLLELIVLATRTSFRWYHPVLAVILLAGIFLSGSRTVFVLLLLTAVLLAVFQKNRTVRLVSMAAVPFAVAVAAIYAVATGDTGAIGRFLTTSLHSSTLLGRLLYARDALPVILRHPLGLGWGSYAYMQGSFQTGVYSVQTVHNDLLQLMLDAGWLPGVLVTIAVIKALFHRGGTLRRKLMLGILCAHGLFDFSLQFLSILLLLVLLLENDNKTDVRMKRGDRRFLTAACSVLMVVSLYFGSASFMQYLGRYDAALGMYGGYTTSLVNKMIETADLAEADGYAERILRLNRYVAPAYRVRAAKAYNEGDFQTVIEQQRKAIVCAPYDINMYTDYLDMLNAGVQRYESAGEYESAEYCREQMRLVPGWIQDTIDKTSKLGWQIVDRPELILSDSYLAMLSSL